MAKTCRKSETGCGAQRRDGHAELAEIEPDLAEWDCGECEGQAPCGYSQGTARLECLRDVCPGGELPAQVSERADRLIARLRALEGNIAIFSRGHFGRVLATRWIGLQIRQARNLLLSTVSISILGYEHNRAESPAIVFVERRFERIFGLIRRAKEVLSAASPLSSYEIDQKTPRSAEPLSARSRHVPCAVLVEPSAPECQGHAHHHA
jgi:broad specificity phosphatase PhoE